MTVAEDRPSRCDCPAEHIAIDGRCPVCPLAGRTQWRMRWNDGKPDSVTTVREQARAWMRTVGADAELVALLVAFERSDDDGATWQQVTDARPLMKEAE